MERSPKRIQEALVDRSTEIEYPIEAIIEMASGEQKSQGLCYFLLLLVLLASVVLCVPLS